MPQLATPLAGQIKVLNFGPSSTQAPPPLPANTGGLAKAQIVGALAQAIGQLPGIITKTAEVHQTAESQDELKALWDAGQREGIKIDEKGNLSYSLPAASALKDPTTVQSQVALNNARVETQKALTQKYLQPPTPRAVPLPKTSLYEREMSGFGGDPSIGADNELFNINPDGAVPPAEGDEWLAPEALEGGAPAEPLDSSALEDIIKFDESGNALEPATDEIIAPADLSAAETGARPMDAITLDDPEPEGIEGFDISPETSVAALEGALPAKVTPRATALDLNLDGTVPATVPGAKVAAKAPPVDVRRATPAAAPVKPAATSETGIPTGENIVARGNKWMDKSSGIISMKRTDGAIYDLLPGTNRWVQRKVTGKDAAATLKPTADVNKRVLNTVGAIEGLQELLTKRQTTPEAGPVEKLALVKQSQPSEGILDSIGKQLAQKLVSKDAMNFEAARNRINSLIVFAQGGQSLTANEKKALTVVEPDDAKDAAITKMETAIPLIKRELKDMVTQYPGYYPQAEKLLGIEGKPAKAGESEAPKEGAKASGSGTRADPFKVDTKEAYDALASGAFFIDSSGKLKKKP